MEQHEYDHMYRQEAQHYWFAAKREMAMSLLASAAPRKGRLRILDAGCGTGKTAEDLSRLGQVTCLDFSPDAVRYTAQRGLREVVCASCTHMPFETGSFDAAVALDLLEHIDRDMAALCEFRRVLADDAAFVVTVPAHPALFGAHDRHLHHFRRYTRRELYAKVSEAGFRVEKLSYWNSALFLPFAALRLAEKLTGRDSGGSDAERPLPEWANRALFNILAWEGRRVVAGRLPLGLSLVAVLRPAVTAGSRFEAAGNSAGERSRPRAAVRIG